LRKSKALDEHLESTHFHGSCLRADVHVLIEDCHNDAKWAIDQAIRLWDSISSDESPFFRFHQSYMNVSLNRKFFVTEDCEMGIGLADLNLGDQICALLGGRTPYIVRPIEGSLDEYQFVGGCYIKKWMSGEAVDLVGEGVLNVTWLKFR
jgi:hypothetical protein